MADLRNASLEEPSAAQSDGPPPGYSAVETGGPARDPQEDLPPEAIAELNAAFASLQLPLVAKGVEVDTCLAHLKLLSAFQTLKDDVGYTDGLFDIFDARVVPHGTSQLNSAQQEQLAKLREKRWALYVARAVDRYEAWWNTFDHDLLTGRDMEGLDSPKYMCFTKSTTVKNWLPTMLPPLDVLMVWHAHMLNPRVYLEDCMRYGLRETWTAGMPWKLVNDAIDMKFDYKPGSDSTATWENFTGRKWDNAEDPVTKSLKCPSCSRTHQVPWTTCGMPENGTGQDPGLTGQGYGDGDFTYVCRCGVLINGQFLEVAKFVKDVQTLLTKDCPMPGTILDFKSGLPEPVPSSPGPKNVFERTFPNRLIKRHLRSVILDLVNPARAPPATMDNVRVLIEDAIREQAVLKKVDSVEGMASLRRYRLTTRARVPLRKMMSRYWGNFSPFSLELGGAVIRQGIFTEKMYKIDWLHSPAAKDTMSRIITKYERFTNIMAANVSTQVTVPTLDVDLAWHTHQLSPRSYYDSMVQKSRQLIDHDDKINEDKLTSAFEWTSRIYQEQYGEVYSECTCWYCEAIRASHVSSVGKLLGVSKNEKISENFHASGQAKLCPPDNSAHISAHNAVRFKDEDHTRNKVARAVHNAQITKLEENYKKAKRRAQKKGRTIPPRDEYYYYYWGYPYMMYGPWVYPMYYTPGLYYCEPGVVAAGSGFAGACCTGTCGGGAAAGACAGAATGACGGAGGCGGGCGASGGCAGGGGGCGGGGFGGGGCGGGGGGGCGGGGGGA